MPTVVNLDPTVYNSSTAEFTLGGIYTWQGKEYIYVRLDNTASSTNAAANGDCFAWASTAAGYVSNILSGSGSSTAYLGNPPAGVAVGTITAGNYGFLLVRGRHTAVKGIATVSVGQNVKISSTAASASNVAAATDGSLGVALTALAAPGTFTCEVRCM